MIESMRIRRRKSEEININLTPLIDVVFLLLIFFMVSTTFKDHAELGVELPHSKNLKASSSSPGIEVGVSALGDYFLDGKPLGQETKALEKALSAHMAQQGKGVSAQPMLIMGDKMAPHQSVIGAMDVAQKLGITQIKMITEQRD